MTGPSPSHDPLRRSIERRQRHKSLWDKEGERPLARNLALAGALGWLIVTPTLVGVFLGRWLDGVFGTGITLTAAFLFAGVVGGCVLAWNRVHRE